MSGGEERQEDQVNTFAVVLVGISSAILLWATVVLLQAYYENSAEPLQVERDARGKGKEMRDLRASQQAALQEARYLPGSPDNPLVTLPIEVAKKKVVADLLEKKALLVPSVGSHDKATVPAVPGKPTDAAPAGGAAPPAGAVPAPGINPASPAPSAGAPGSPAPGNSPAPGATPAPAPASGTTPAPAGSPPPAGQAPPPAPTP